MALSGLDFWGVDWADLGSKSESVPHSDQLWVRDGRETEPKSAFRLKICKGLRWWGCIASGTNKVMKCDPEGLV